MKPDDALAAGPAVVGERVRRLRLAVGLSQSDLAETSGQAAGVISMLENGRLSLSRDVIVPVTRALGCTFEYIVSPAPHEPLATRPWLRAYADASKRAVDTAVADATTALDVVDRLQLRRIPDTLPLFVGDLNDDEEIEAFSLDVREAAGIDRDAVVPNVMRAAERLGCVLLPMEDELGRHLGLSLRIDNAPVIRVARPSDDPDQTVPGDRQRFTVAHELGHLALHHASPPPNTPGEAARIEKQAHRFASAFLAPGDPVLADLERLGGRVTLSTLAELKRIWGLAIKAFVVRFRQLEIIGDDQARSLYKQISSRRWNKNEPVPVGNEEAVWLLKAMEERVGVKGTTVDTAADVVGLDRRHLVGWVDWSPRRAALAPVLDLAARARTRR